MGGWFGGGDPIGAATTFGGLTATYVAYAGTGGTLTSKSTFTFNASTNVLTVGAVTVTSDGTKDAPAVIVGATSGGSNDGIFRDSTNGWLGIAQNATYNAAFTGVDMTLRSDGSLKWASGTDIQSTGADSFLGRKAAASFRLGATSSGSAINQTFGAHDTTGADKLGANMTYTAGNGTGNQGSGAIIFQTAPAHASDSVAGTMTTRLSISNAGAITIGGMVFDQNNRLATTGGSYIWYGTQNIFRYADTVVMSWSADGNAGGTADTGLARVSAGILRQAFAGTQQHFRVYDSTPTNYVNITHDGTNAVISSSAGLISLSLADLSTGANTVLHVGTATITGGVTDGYVAGLRLTPTYNAATAQTVTRHNYFDVNNVTLGGAGPAALTNGCLHRFNAAAGTHCALDGATTKTTPGGVDAWVKINVNGTLYYMPAYTSKTA